MALGTLASVGSLAGLVGDRWPFELASHFRIHFGAGLLLLAAALGIRRQWKPAVPFLAVALLDLSALAPYYSARPAAPAEDGVPIRLLVANVLGRSRQYGRMEAYIRSVDADVVVLTEYRHSWRAGLAALEDTFPHSLQNPQANNSGIALFSKQPLTEARLLQLGQPPRGSLLAVLPIGGRELSLVATHPAPPFLPVVARRQDDQFAALASLLGGRNSPAVLCGDLNTTPWSADFRRILRDAGLVDSAIGRDVPGTYPSLFGPLGIPIDHFLITSDLRVVRRVVGPPVGSDHRPLWVDLEVTPLSPE